MGPNVTNVGREVAAAVLSEAADELRGRSNRKWAVMLLAFLVGMVVAVVVIKRRGGTLPGAYSSHHEQGALARAMSYARERHPS